MLDTFSYTLCYTSLTSKLTTSTDEVYRVHVSVNGICTSWDEFLRADFLPINNQGGTKTKMAAFGRSRRDVFMNASLGLYTLPVVDKISHYVHSRGCGIRRYIYG